MYTRHALHSLGQILCTIQYVAVKKYIYNLKLIPTVVIIIKIEMKLFVMYVGDLLTTCFGPKGPSSGIKVTKKNYRVVSGLYINWI